MYFFLELRNCVQNILVQPKSKMLSIFFVLVRVFDCTLSKNNLVLYLIRRLIQTGKGCHELPKLSCAVRGMAQGKVKSIAQRHIKIRKKKFLTSATIVFTAHLDTQPLALKVDTICMSRKCEN